MDYFPEKFRTDLSIIRETAKQIERDFGIADLDLVISGNELLAFDELISQLCPIIHRLFKDDRKSLQAILYRVDLPEKEYRKALKSNDDEGTDQVLSKLIIQREFQKVLTRKYFSDKQKK